MYELKYLTEQDMPYFRRLAEEGKAIIIELSDQALFRTDPESMEKMPGEVDQSSLDEVLRKLPPALIEKCKEGQRMAREIREMEEMLLSGYALRGSDVLVEKDNALQSVERMAEKQAGQPAEQHAEQPKWQLAGPAMDQPADQVSQILEELIMKYMRGVSVERTGI